MIRRRGRDQSFRRGLSVSAPVEDRTMTMGRRRWIGVTAGAVVGGLGAQASVANAAAAGLTFEVYHDAKKEYRWRLKSANGQVVATSGEGYKAKADCLRGIELVQ